MPRFCAWRWANFTQALVSHDWPTALNKKSKKQAKKNQDAAKESDVQLSPAGKNVLQVRLPKSLFDKLQKKKRHEDVDMEQLVTYLLMRGLND